MKATRKFLFTVGVAALCVLLPTTDAMAAPPPTTVSPAGDYVSLSVSSIKLGPFDCFSAESTPRLPLGTNANNRIPTANNPNPSGAMKFPIRAPKLWGSCTPSEALADVRGRGVWTVNLQHKASGDVAKLKIPKAGIEIHHYTPEGGECWVTVAPDNFVTITGTWTNGAPSTMTVTGNVPVRSPGCGGDTVFSVSLTFSVTDASNADAHITVS